MQLNCLALFTVISSLKIPPTEAVPNNREPVVNKERVLSTTHFGCPDDDNPVAYCIMDKATCESTDGNYFCQCKDGFSGDGMRNCLDFDECKEAYPCPGTKDVMSFCVDYAPPLKYKCQCKSPYLAVLPDESDITDPVPIDWRPADCVEPSPTPGLTLEPTPTTPQPTTPEPTLEPTPSYLCNNDLDCTGENKMCTDDGVCDCQSGYFSTNGLLSANCVNENECLSSELNICHRFATCEDTIGSFTCSCNEGYTDSITSTSPGTDCVNYDECANGADDCDDDQICFDRNPPQKWECVDPTPAPTPAPTPPPVPPVCTGYCIRKLRDGEEFAVKEDMSLSEAVEIIELQKEFGARADATFYSRYDLISKKSCDTLVDYLDESLAKDRVSGTALPVGKAESLESKHESWTFLEGIENRYNKKLYADELVNMIGPEEVKNIIDFFEESLGELNIDCMHLARHAEPENDLYVVPWHTDDYATVEITLNDNYGGGKVLHLNGNGVHVTQPFVGSAVAHDSDIVHGITPNVGGAKHMLILKHHYNQPDKVGVVRLSKALVDEISDNVTIG